MEIDSEYYDTPPGGESKYDTSMTVYRKARRKPGRAAWYKPEPLALPAPKKRAITGESYWGMGNSVDAYSPKEIAELEVSPLNKYSRRHDLDIGDFKYPIRQNIRDDKRLVARAYELYKNGQISAKQYWATVVGMKVAPYVYYGPMKLYRAMTKGAKRGVRGTVSYKGSKKQRLS